MPLTLERHQGRVRSKASLKRRHHELLAGQLDPIAWLYLAAAPLFQLAIDAHIALLDPEFGFAARSHQALPFEELIKAQLACLLQQASRIPSQGAWVARPKGGRLDGAGCGGLPSALPVWTWG